MAQRVDRPAPNSTLIFPFGGEHAGVDARGSPQVTSDECRDRPGFPMPARLAARLSGLTLGKRRLPFKVLLLVVIALVLSPPWQRRCPSISRACERALTGCDIRTRYYGTFRWRKDGLLEAESAERGYLLRGERELSG